MTKALEPEIVRLRLEERLSIRRVAERVGVDKDTVQRWWSDWCARQSPDDPAELAALRDEHIEVLEQIASDARADRSRALGDPDGPDLLAADRALNTQLRAEQQIAKLRGLDQPTKLELSGKVDVGVSVETLSDEELDRLADGG